MSQNIVIIGSSGHAKVLIDAIEKEAKYTIAGIVDSSRSVGEEQMGYPVLGGEPELPGLLGTHDISGGVVAIGDNFTRSEVVARIKKALPSFQFVPIVHPDASVARGVVIGEGSVVLSGVCLEPSVSVGSFCILNTCSSLSHDSSLGDFGSLAPGVVTGGNCHIGNFSAICIGATLIHGVSVGECSVVGAGSLVLDSVEPYSVVYGVPAEKVRTRDKSEAYL